MAGVKGKTGKYKHSTKQLFQKGHTINLGKKQTEESNEKRRQTLLGHKTSEDTKIKIGKANSIALKLFWKNNPEHKNKLPQLQKGIIPWNKNKLCPWAGENGFKKGNIAWNKGMLGYHKLEEHYNWQGGISKEEYGIRWTKELKKEIRKRDNWECQTCACKNKKLVVHHKDLNKKNCSENNLITLCQTCHMKLHHSIRREVKNEN